VQGVLVGDRETMGPMEVADDIFCVRWQLLAGAQHEPDGAVFSAGVVGAGGAAQAGLKSGYCLGAAAGTISSPGANQTSYWRGRTPLAFS